MLENLISGFQISLSAQNILVCFVGVTLGTVVGVLPGLGPAATIAMLLTLTYRMELAPAIIMLAGIYYGAQYGGTITSVLLKIPGEASTVVTVIDGHQMGLKGQAGKALGIAAFGSFIAGIAGTIGLSLLAPPLSGVALMFGPPEYTSLMVLGLILVVYLGGGSILKSMLMCAVGLALGTIGMDKVTGVERFTFGSESLVEGLDMAIVAMGIFGVGEILFNAANPEARSSEKKVKCPSRLKELLPNRQDWRASIGPIGRGSVLGFFLGIIPGGGALIASFSSYVLEKKLSRTPDRFGRGAIEGVAGPESANNAAVSGAFIPLLTLGIPSNVVMALLVAAFMLHGVTPGPFLLRDHSQLFWAIITSMFIGNVMLVILNVPMIKLFVKITEVPFSLLAPVIVLICVVGAYSINNNVMDVLFMLFFAAIGYFIRAFDFEPAPIMLAFVLGPMLETSFRQSLIASQGSIEIFFSRPISLALLLVAILMVVSSAVASALKKSRTVSPMDPSQVR